MTLSVDDAARVRESHAIIRSASLNYSELFYHRLLQRHPFTRVLFPDDMTRQLGIFRQTIDALVDQLDDLVTLRPTLAAIAIWHVRYGVGPRHYLLVGEVLVDTFAEIVGPGFCSRTRAAWHVLYEATAGIMIAEACPAGGSG